jgi:hypothetical protein
LVPSGKPEVAVRSPGVSGAQTEAVAEARGATTKFGAVAVPVSAAVKPEAITLVVLTVLVRLNTSNRSLKARMICLLFLLKGQHIRRET